MKNWITNTALHTCLLLLLLSAVIFLRMQDHDWAKSLRYLAFDTYNVLWERKPTNQVIVVDIDEVSLQDDRLGQWPWPRSDVAQLVDQLDRMGASAIVFDIVFAEKDRTSPATLLRKLPDDALNAEQENLLTSLPDPDDTLAESIKTSGRVVTGFPLSNSANATRRTPTLSKNIITGRGINNFARGFMQSEGVTTNIPLFENAAAGNGGFSLSPEVDGIIRKVPLFYNINGQAYPSLALEAVRVSQNPKLSHKIRPLKQKELSALSSPLLLKIGKYQIPMDETGLFYIHYAKARTNTYIPAWQVIDGIIKPDVIKDKIILIGTSAQGLKDIRSTPLDLYVPGVEGHLNAIEQILQGHFITRPSLVDGAELIFTATVGILLIVLALYANVLVLALLSANIILCLGTASIAMFKFEGLLIDPVYPSLTILIMFILSSLLSYIRTEHDRRAVKEAFGLYISPDYIKQLGNNPDQLRLGGETKEITVMFTDIRNFTSISEQLTPQRLIHLMNEFLTPMSDLVMSNKGTIDKYIGDAMMAFWNAPLDDPEHAKHACIAALQMNEKLTPINNALAAEAQKEGREPIILRAGIGVNTGAGAVGNMGSDQRFAYSALGDSVNLAARLESQTKAYGVDILIGEKTYEALDAPAALELDYLRVVGKQEPIRIYALIDLKKSDEFISLEAAHTKMLEHYRAQEFDKALKVIKTCQSCATDRISGYYEMMSNRIKAMKTSPPDKDWDGVFTAQSK